MQLLVFDLRASLAHFRRPDTTATHSTYPFITRTALRGLLGAILGFDEFLDTGWTGVQLVKPVKTRSQELSLLGKGFLAGQSTFNRPTSVQLVIDPHYRIYYAGDHIRELNTRIAAGRSTYVTYLGSAFAPCVPEYRGLHDVVELQPVEGDTLESIAVVPVHVIQHLELSKTEPKIGYQLARANGFLYEYKGNREFSGTIDLMYELSGQPIRFQVKENESHKPVRFANLSDGRVVTLW